MPKVLVNDENLTNIANAIREKNGETTTYKPGDMATAIQNISSGGGGDPELEASFLSSIDGSLGANITLATAIADADCYIVALGFNDRGGKVKLGSAADIVADKSTNADSFYGNYDYIINTLLNVNDKVHIFLLTMPAPVDTNHAYNVAIRNIAALYSSRVHLIDLAENYNDYYSEGIIADTFNGHGFPLTYQLMSMIIQKAISSYIVNNYSQFYGTPWNGK